MSELKHSDGVNDAIRLDDAVVTVMLRQAEAWASAQSRLLSDVEQLWADWTTWQREAMEASNRTLQRMGECRNLADLAQLHQHWIADTTRRATLNFGTLANDAAALTGRIGKTERPVFAAGRRQAASRPEPPQTSESSTLQREAAK